ncbi:hypothetical protein K438DRAFT_1820209 [Mycena galopus ATCC 62051]|nr:hypothetical protein K438DRAFT_1820209 [Mycena galopus ATCC 62051]
MQQGSFKALSCQLTHYGPSALHALNFQLHCCLPPVKYRSFLSRWFSSTELVQRSTFP